jgi:hypothetical protein
MIAEPLARHGLGSPLIICGMHRSGTSLAASVLRHAGLDLGRRMNGPGPGNPRGHFEDFDVWQLHEEMLAAAGHTAFSAGDDFTAPLVDGFAARAAALVAARAGERPWGWKDPRTCLFLDFWEALLPAASYLVLYRHPADVVLSLLRRNTEPSLNADPRLAFEAWTVYNRRLVDWCTRDRARCFVAQAPALAVDLDDWVRRVAGRFGLPLQPDGAATLFAPAELAAAVPEARRPPWERVIPEALDLYRRLDAIADLPAAPSAPPLAAETPREEAAGQRAPAEVRLSEWLLYDLLQAHAVRRQQTAAAEAFAVALEQERAAASEVAAALEEERGRSAALRQELVREHEEAAVLRQRLVESAARHHQAMARRDELAATLTKIERSRSFRLVAAWWRIARRAALFQRARE